MDAPQPTLFALHVETWDLEGLDPAAMTRDQLTRAILAFLSQGTDMQAARVLLSAASTRLSERTYRDGIDLERCALCLQEIRIP